MFVYSRQSLDTIKGMTATQEYQRDAIFEMAPQDQARTLALATAANDPWRSYVELMGYYFANDLEALRKRLPLIRAELANGTAADRDVIDLFCLARSLIRTDQVQAHELVSRIEAVEHSSDAVRGEGRYIAAVVCERQDDWERAAQNYLQAYELFSEAQCQSKALHSLHNYLAAMTNKYPTKIFIVEYFAFLKKIRRLRDPQLKGTVLFNISREFQLLGSSRLAFACCERAIKFLSREPNSRTYALARVHRLELWGARGDESLTERLVAEYVELRKSPFAEVQGALNVIRELYIPEAKSKKSGVKSAQWRQRRYQSSLKDKRPNLTPGEETVLWHLVRGEKTKKDLARLIHGTDDYSEVEASITSVLYRLKKKLPKYIRHEDGRYSFFSTTYLLRAEKLA